MNFQQAILLAITIHDHGMWCVASIDYMGSGNYEIIAYPILRGHDKKFIRDQDGWERARTQEEERIRVPAISRSRPRRRSEA
jgi:hypothetical protein